MPPIRPAAFATIALLPVVQGARAQTVTTVSPFGQQGVQTLPGTLPFWAPAPYWTRPYWAAPYWAPQNGTGVFPGTTTVQPGLAQPQPFTDPNGSAAASNSPTSVAPGYMCPATAPAGQPCACPANDGGAIAGVVR